MGVRVCHSHLGYDPRNQGREQGKGISTRPLEVIICIHESAMYLRDVHPEYRKIVKNKILAGIGIRTDRETEKRTILWGKEEKLGGL